VTYYVAEKERKMETEQKLACYGTVFQQRGRSICHGNSCIILHGWQECLRGKRGHLLKSHPLFTKAGNPIRENLIQWVRYSPPNVAIDFVIKEEVSNLIFIVT
jgi:hypothetical protein